MGSPLLIVSICMCKSIRIQRLMSPDMTEILLTGALRLNAINKRLKLFSRFTLIDSACHHLPNHVVLF